VTKSKRIIKPKIFITTTAMLKNRSALTIMPSDVWNKKPFLLNLNIRGPNSNNTDMKMVVNPRVSGLKNWKIMIGKSKKRKISLSLLFTGCGGGTLGPGK
jgi:hypothetical protein